MDRDLEAGSSLDTDDTRPTPIDKGADRGQTGLQDAAVNSELARQDPLCQTDG